MINNDKLRQENNQSLADGVIWRPLLRGGTSWRTHKVKDFEEKLKILPTQPELILGWVIFISTVFATLFAAPYLFFLGRVGMGIFTLITAVLFALGGYAMIKSTKHLTFDFFKGVYYQGKESKDDLVNVEKSQHQRVAFFRITEYGHLQSISHQAQGKIADIKALQVIDELVRVKNQNLTKRAFVSYELNMILKNGERINIMDHGNVKKFEEDLAVIQTRLQVPVWRFSEFQKTGKETSSR